MNPGNRAGESSGSRWWPVNARRRAGRWAVGLVVAVMGGSVVWACRADQVVPKRGLREVPLKQVDVRGGFWGRRLETHGRVTIPYVLDWLEKTGHVTNFDKAAGKFDGPLKGNHAFDSDLYKALEGVMYSLMHRPDRSLQQRAESMIDRILAAQQPDGFLITWSIVEPPEDRWANMRLEHHLYNTGHFFEMAEAHYRLTGRRRVLEAACRFADLVDRVFGPGKRYDVPGHEEIELALVKLYRATGQRRYLELSRFFLDERGHAHGMSRRPFDPTTQPTEIPSFDHLPPAERNRAVRRFRNSIRNGRMQDHKPLVEQEAVGHAVRAGYVYAAMTDIARFMDAPDYHQAVLRLWRDVVGRKMYITAGIGTAQYHDEGFGDPYLLPNRTYCESCANIAHVLWQYRLALLEAQACYADVMELGLYNSALSGIQLDGKAFFYTNPLASQGARRYPWIGLACCPTNLARFIAQVGALAYARRTGQLYVNLYVAGEVSTDIAPGLVVRLGQQTDYPWDGKVRLTVGLEQPAGFDLALRLPGWARGRPVPSDLYRFAEPSARPVGLKINGKPCRAEPQPDGYVHLERQWQDGDVVEVDLPMPVRRVYAHRLVEADRGRVALMRGPVVYCLEGVEHPGVDLDRLLLPPQAELKAVHRPDLLGGVTVVQARALVEGEGPVTLTAVPYYAWANRDKGPMRVWIREQPSPAPPPAK